MVSTNVTMFSSNASIRDAMTAVLVPTTEQHDSNKSIRDARPTVLVPTTSQHDSRALIDDCNILVVVPTTNNNFLMYLFWLLTGSYSYQPLSNMILINLFEKPACLCSFPQPHNMTQAH